MWFERLESLVSMFVVMYTAKYVLIHTYFLHYNEHEAKIS